MWPLASWRGPLALAPGTSPWHNRRRAWEMPGNARPVCSVRVEQGLSQTSAAQAAALLVTRNVRQRTLLAANTS
jgi:hypothetical protein